MKIKNIFTILLVTFILASCASATKVVQTETAIPTLTFTPVPTSTLTSVPFTPTITPAPIATTKVERWMEYEHVLALEILWSSDAICEWSILGQKNQEIYVWAICETKTTNLAMRSAGSSPAVIFLGNNGSIEKVQIPGDGTQYGIDIRKMFPKQLHDKIFEQSVGIDEMLSHIELRQINPEPPLIVLSGVPLP
ncbi:MAG: hypothetical protein HY864_14570 [Chloroflexi bacterium]|nr:hypothetical protein [Chloroflexota bacterium]